MQQTTRGWRERLAARFGLPLRALWRGWAALRELEFGRRRVVVRADACSRRVVGALVNCNRLVSLQAAS